MPAVIDRYASPEALAKVADAPVAVCELIFIVTAGDRRHLELFRNGLAREKGLFAHAKAWDQRAFELGDERIPNGITVRLRPDGEKYRMPIRA